MAIDKKKLTQVIVSPRWLGLHEHNEFISAVENFTPQSTNSKWIDPSDRLVKTLNIIDAHSKTLFIVPVGNFSRLPYWAERRGLISMYNTKRAATAEEIEKFSSRQLTATLYHSHEVEAEELNIRLSNQGRRLVNAAARGLVWNLKGDRPADHHRTINYYITQLQTGAISHDLLTAINRLEGKEFDDLKAGATWYALTATEKGGKLVHPDFCWDRPRKARTGGATLQSIIEHRGSII
jgi:hypothetical protein